MVYGGYDHFCNNQTTAKFISFFPFVLRSVFQKQKIGRKFSKTIIHSLDWKTPAFSTFMSGHLVEFLVSHAHDNNQIQIMANKSKLKWLIQFPEVMNYFRRH